MTDNNINSTSAAKSPILVGVIQLKIDDQTFFVSKALLEQNAPNFPLNTTELKDVSVTTIEAFLNWMGIEQDDEWDKTQFRPLNLLYDEPIPSIDRWSMVQPLCELFILGVTYVIPALRKDALRGISRCIAAVVEASNQLIYLGRSTGCVPFHAQRAITYAYAKTAPGSPLRKILIDGFCATRFYSQNKDWLRCFPPAFLLDALHGKIELTSTIENRKEALGRVKEWQVSGEDKGKEATPVKRKRPSLGNSFSFIR
ncbi:hypothetical protein N0V83_008942 [Neocucurbitaria cava]|uniref:BTB domain-containing protein n=1 Tax=Neocucurbitaria cava TaxID=798079 RepID=A0A9W8Y4I2_9PLEO|nr:hypothetical protein N0V83_008942 [Neocucurbitaria cava]